MYLLSWVIIGLITGWLTGKLAREGGYGPMVNIVMGAPVVTATNACDSDRKRYA
jgi:uncharacterized membrane protein YeaQ/YmgE (transglycosylase-associated protein family)